MKRAMLVLGVLYAGAIAGAIGCARAVAAPAEEAPATTGLSATEAAQIATDAYVFAYPLVTMQMTKAVMTNTRKAGPELAPVGQLANHRQYPEASNHAVTAPNADTLYSTAWLDLSKEPMVFSHPDMGRRFYMFPMLDAYTNVLRTPGARDNGGAPATFVIIGPEWKGGQLPPGAVAIRSPTNMVWILGRTYSSGTPQDYAQVHALQAQYQLRPLGAGAGYKPAPGRVDPKIDGKTSVRDQVDAMKAEAFFGMAAQLMGANPPATEDAPIMARMARIGLLPGQPFKMSQLPPEAASAVQAAPKAGQERIKAQLKKGGVTMANGWLMTMKAGTYGTDYDQRAFVAAIGLGANRPEQAIYPFAETDSSGQKLSGQNAYVVHFAAGQMPPVKGFWSITMYTPKMFFYPNPMKVYTVSSRTDFHKNDDGSVDVYIQNQKPASAEQRSNWLPAPKEAFVLMMRLYWPEQRKPSILDGSWKPPAVTKANAAPRMGRTLPPRR